jgi:hypothetical protein
MFNVTLQEKVIATHGSEQVIAILSPKKLRTLAQVFEAMELGVV